MSEIPSHEKQAIIWDYFKPRHTHAWNMLVLSWRALDAPSENIEEMMEEEYYWENFIIRLWLYRITVKTLTQLDHVRSEAEQIISEFDNNFETNGKNGLKAIRDMIEHFDDYAAGKGRGPATREGELDPWRAVSRDRFERGRYVIERAPAYDAAIRLRSDAKRVSDNFIAWYKASR
ncbi:MAG: hypothetical protein AAF217_12455 [Pseudomonadota bacterium]